MLGSIRNIFLEENPPFRVKVFAPNGETKELTGWVGIRAHPRSQGLADLVLLHSNGKTEVLNKKVVVQNRETGEVIYNPRLAPTMFGDRVLIRMLDTLWLARHPEWPAVLELDDNPVENGEETDGIH